MCRYAKALRPLRQIAQVYTFTLPGRTQLIDRLRFVAKCENVPCDNRGIAGASVLRLHRPRSLSAAACAGLVDVCGGDIRSCMHTLQFAAKQRTG